MGNGDLKEAELMLCLMVITFVEGFHRSIALRSWN